MRWSLGFPRRPSVALGVLCVQGLEELTRRTPRATEGHGEERRGLGIRCNAYFSGAWELKPHRSFVEGKFRNESGYPPAKHYLQSLLTGICIVKIIEAHVVGVPVLGGGWISLLRASAQELWEISGYLQLNLLRALKLVYADERSPLKLHHKAFEV